MAKLHFLFAVMNAGKTTHLLQVRHNYIENGGHVLVFTSVVDSRFGKGRIASRLGIEADATSLSASDDLAAIVLREHERRPVTVVLIDEVQFMTPDHVRQAAWIVDTLDVPVMAYGLKNNAYGRLFGETVSVLLALADTIREIKQLCHCGRKATMILKYDPSGAPVRSGEIVELGDESRYVSVCRRHWNEGDIGPAARAHLGSKVVPGS